MLQLKIALKIRHFALQNKIRYFYSVTGAPVPPKTSPLGVGGRTVGKYFIKLFSLGGFDGAHDNVSFWSRLVCRAHDGCGRVEGRRGR